jgi:predicted RNase H-like HicB family nuclease
LGYACCSPGNTVVYYQDENGDWGVENDDWCGITRAEAPACWSDKLGYPCCSGCTENVYEDNDGKWGVENGDWCGIPINC